MVSIVILTYNSSEFILETLGSVKCQTYKNIELILADDNSNDDTVIQCRHWIAENKERFVNSLIITCEKNSGIVGNANRAIKALQGEWVKFLGGDDLLLPTCIESNLSFASRFPNNHLIVSKIVSFDSQTGKDLRILPEKKITNNNGPIQLKEMLKGHYIMAPGVILSKTLLNKLDNFDPRYPMYEDNPFWIKANLAGYFFVENPEILVRYRISHNSISNNPTIFINPLFYKSFKKYTKERVYPLLKKKGMYKDLLYFKIRFWLSNRVLKKGNNIKSPSNLFERIMFKVFSIIR